MIAAGRTNPEIATALGVTIDGAKWHVREIITKLGVDSREEAADVWRKEQRLTVRAQRLLAHLASGPVWVKAVLGAGVVAGTVAVSVAGLLALGVLDGGSDPDSQPGVTESTGTPAGSPQDEQRIIRGAIEALSELLAIDQARIKFDSIEVVDWPSDCLGVEPPGVACNQVSTPGYRVWLSVGGQPQIIHASATGSYRLAPVGDAERTIAAIDLSSGRVVLAPLAGSDEMGSDHRLFPGSHVAGSLADFQPGDRVSIAVAGQLPDEDVGLIVWLVPIP